MNIRDKNVLVTGATGMIGSEVVKLLLKMKAVVTATSNESWEKFEQVFGLKYYDICVESEKDLTDLDTCDQLVSGMDVVFHMAGVKGNPKMCKEKPASFFVPMVQFNTNMLEACRLNKVPWTLFTSSIGVYGNPECTEDEMWDSYPSKNDWHAGWAKRMGELQIDAYNKQYGLNNFSIIRPGNVFGKYDNFNPETGMVIPSLIHRIESGENPLEVWGDGTPIRDFIYAEDVAKICVYLVRNEITQPVNAARGLGVSISEIVNTILRYTKNKPKVVYDTSKPKGDSKRVLNIERLKSLGFSDFTNFDVAIKETVDWYNNNKDIKRYDPFVTI